MTSNNIVKLGFVACASNPEVLSRRLLASPCLRQGGHDLTVYFNSSSAAQGFNAAMAAAKTSRTATWLVWVHQDVYLPEGWDTSFAQGIEAALRQFPTLAVAGVYGVAGAGASHRRLGQVLDRGRLLKEAEPLPGLVDSLDELLFAVRVDADLPLDPALGFDFYGTDLVLQAQAQGWQCAVIDAYCEHWADTPASGGIPNELAQRIRSSALVFENKWAQRLPVSTPCFEIAKVGDVTSFIESLGVLSV